MRGRDCEGEGGGRGIGRERGRGWGAEGARIERGREGGKEIKRRKQAQGSVVGVGDRKGEGEQMRRRACFRRPGISHDHTEAEAERKGE